jgi:hypothetical protein
MVIFASLSRALLLKHMALRMNRMIDKAPLICFTAGALFKNIGPSIFNPDFDL